MRWSASPLTVVFGERGSGKSFNAGFIVAKICKRVIRQRRPRQVAIWVNAAKVDTVEVVTTDLIAEHVAAAAAYGNMAVAEFLADRMRTGRGRVRWLVVIDSVDDLPLGDQLSDREAAVQSYLERARDFARTRERVRVVAIMRSAPDLPSDIPVHEAEPLTDHQFRELFGADDHPELVARLRFDPYLQPAHESPLLAQMLGAALSDDQPINTGYDLVGRIVEDRVAALSVNVDNRAAVERIASELAWQMAETDNEHSATPADGRDEVNLLVRAGLARVVGDRFRFNHPWFRRYFGARCLVAGQRRLDLRWALRHEMGAEFVVTALHSGSPDLTEQAVRDAVTILEEEKKATDPALPTVLTLPEPSGVGPGGVRWPERVGDLMILLRDGLCHMPGSLLGQPAITESATQMVRAAMVAGSGRVRRLALQLLPLAAPTTAADFARLILVDREDPTLVEPLIQQLAWLPNVNAQLEPLALARTLFSENGSHMLNTLQDAPPAAREPHSLPWRMRSLLRVGKVVAWGFLPLGLYMSTTSDVAGALTLWLIATIFLTNPRVRAESRPGFVAYICGAMFGVATVIGAINGIADVIQAVVFSGGPLVALKNAILAYLTTWPAAMLATTLLGKPATPADWLLPHVPLIRRHVVPWLASRLRPMWTSPEIRSIVTRPSTLVPVLLGILCLVLAIGHLTALPPRVENIFDFSLVAAASLLFVVPGLRVRWRLRANRNRLTATLYRTIPEDIDDEWLLEMINQAAERSRTSVGGLLRRLSDMDSTMLAKVVQVLEDLDAALEFTRKVLPQDTDDYFRVPPAVFALAGPFSRPQFDNWLMDFESQHPGILDWLANNCRVLIAAMVEHAHHPDQ